MQPRPSRPDPASSFATVADAFDRARPSYPREAVEWLVGPSPSTVVELGAGTGKMTDRLVELGHDVLATEPLEEMLEHLRARHPGLRTLTVPAEAVPVATRTVDTVVAAQAFHWFDADAALREAARMLKHQGRIALVWNEPDQRIPWVRKLTAIVEDDAPGLDPTEALLGSRLFGYVEDATFRFWHQVRKVDLRDLIRSRAHVAMLDPAAQERLLRRVDQLFDDYDRTPGGLMMPFVTRCFRAVVRPHAGLIEEPEHSADLTAAANAVRQAELEARLAKLKGTSDPDDEDPGTTLIDFR